MLHLISQTPLDKAVLQRVGAGDDVVLLEAAMWTVWQGHALNAEIARLLANGCGCYVLQPQLAAYGLGPEKLLPDVVVIDFAGFVALTVKNPVIKTWS